MYIYSNNCILCLSRFIEYGEYKNNQYGTSLEAIRSVLARNKVCLVDVQPEVNVTLLLFTVLLQLLSKAVVLNVVPWPTRGLQMNNTFRLKLDPN